ncbi:MAG TPA: hypothetical protein VFT30_06680, partial [Nitrospira sp.]|nr:hypothetical protein [Nitrospira sp.]
MARNHQWSSLTPSTAAQVRSTEFKSGMRVLSNSELRGGATHFCSPAGPGIVAGSKGPPMLLT